jgi:hypothetical protein
MPQFDLSHGVVFGTFFALSILFFVVGTYYSYSMHSPLSVTEAALRRASRRLNAAERHLKALAARHVKLAYEHGAVAHMDLANLRHLVNAYATYNLRSRDIQAETQASNDPIRGQPLSFTHKPAHPDVWVPAIFKDPYSDPRFWS